MLTSNHISVSICYGYRRLVLKRRKPRWGNFLCKLPICVYIGIEIGKSIHSFSKSCFQRQYEDLDTCCVQGLRILVFWQVLSIYFIVIWCHFLKYLIKYISLLVNFFRHPPTYTLGLLKLRRVVWSFSVSLSSCICIIYVCWCCNSM